MSDYTAHKQSDLLWVSASQVLATPTDTVHQVCKIPKNSIVTNIIVNKTVAYTAPGAVVTIGFTANGETADPDAFMSSATFNPTAVGTSSMLQGSVKNSGGKYFATAGEITVTSDDNAGTAGTFQVFVVYCQLKN